MAGNLSFSIAINLLTENFKKGTNSVKGGLRAMQMQVLTFAAALGASGIGLSNFVSQLIAVARETSRVTTALKNVSGSMGMFADNQRFLLDMAKKYGVEINALTGAFAQFTAASQISGMSMMNQRKIFESVSRAATAFGMSAQDSNSVFLALSQMMSKGKVSSEELRLQMGERLPIALQAMAKAAGVSVAKLDDLMKKGKLMSADVLPKFADALNEMIPNVDTNNLETSMNRLKNAFTEFTKGTGIQSAYKGLIDWLGGAVQNAGENIKAVFTNVAAFVIAVALGKMFKWIAVQLGIAQRAAMVAAAKSAKAAGVAFDAVAWKAQSAAVTVRTAFTRMGAAMKAAFVSALPTAILLVLAMVVAKLKNAYDEAKRVRRIFSDYKFESKISGYTQEVVEIKQQLKIMNDKKQSLENINGAQAKLQKMLGVEKASHKELNELVAKRVELLKETARADFHARKQVETEERNRELAGKMGLSTEQADRIANLNAGRNTSDANSLYYRKIRDEILNQNGKQGPEAIKKVEDYVKEYAQNMRVIADSSAELEKSTIVVNKAGGTTPVVESDDKRTTLQKAEEKYAQSLRELNAKAEIEKMSKNEYNKALDELNASMYIDAKGSNDKQTLESKYFANLQEAVSKPLYSKSLAELEEVQKKHKEEETKLLNLYQNKQLTEKEYKDELRKLTLETAKAAGSISNIGVEGQAYIGAMQFVASTLKPDMPKLEVRDKTFDYKKSKSDIAGEELGVAKNNLEKLKDAAKGNVEQFAKELNAAMLNVTDLETALKIAEVMDDVKKFKEELSDGIYSGMKDIASSADRLVSSFRALDEAFDPEKEASGWEQLMAVWGAMTNVVDSFLSAAKMIESITEITKRLTEAKQKEAEIDTVLTGTKAANAATQTTTAITALSTQTAAEVAASSVKSSAASVEMAAKSTAAYAAIPFVGVGLAASQIATMQAMILAASIPKFETGGIFMGGTASGDKGLARLNKGEMILNAGQQSNLFAAINSGRLGSSQRINIGFDRVRGGDILLAVNNTLKKQGKKPL